MARRGEGRGYWRRTCTSGRTRSWIAYWGATCVTSARSSERPSATGTKAETLAPVDTSGDYDPATETDIDLDFDVDSEFTFETDFDFDRDALVDFSNEWPIVPADEGLESDPEEDLRDAPES